MFRKLLIYLYFLILAFYSFQTKATLQPLNDPLWQQIILDLKTDAAAIAAKYYVASATPNNKTKATEELLKQTAQRYQLNAATVSNFFTTAKTTPEGNDSPSIIFNHVKLALSNWVEPLINLTSVDLTKVVDESFIINHLKPLLPDQTLLTTSSDYKWVTPSVWQLIKLKQTQKVTSCEQRQLNAAQLNQHLAQVFGKDFNTFSQLGETMLSDAGLAAINGQILNENSYPNSTLPFWANILIFGLENLAALHREDLLDLQKQITAETNAIMAISTHLQSYPAILPTDSVSLKALSTDVNAQITALEDFGETCLGSTGKRTVLATAQQKQAKIEIALDSQTQINLEINQINAIATHLQTYPSPLPTDLAQLQSLNVDVNTQIITLENFEETVPNSTGKTAVLATALQLQIKIENAIDTAKEGLSEKERLKAVYKQLTTVELQTPSDKFINDDFDYAVAEVVKPNVTIKAMITLLDNLEKLKGSTYKNAGAAKAAYNDLIDAVQAEIDSVNHFTLQLFLNPQTVNNPLYGYNGVNFYITNGAANVSKQMIALYNINRQHPLDMSPLSDRIFHGEMPQNIMDALYMKKPKLVRSDWIDVNNFKDQFQSALRSGNFSMGATGKNYTTFSDILTADLFLD